MKAPAKAGANISIILGYFQKCLTVDYTAPGYEKELYPSIYKG